MCEACAIDDLELIRAARQVADDLLERLHLPVAKALNLSEPGGFETAVVRLADELRRKTHLADTHAVREALAILDVDWKLSSASQRKDLIAQALQAAGRATRAVPSQIRLSFGKAAEQVVAATRRDGRQRRGLGIGADFNAIDRRAVEYVTRANVLFVRDEYGRRLESFGQEARRVVARGLQEGWGRDDIAEDLSRAASASLVQRSTSYWNLVAASLVGESRSLSQISSYAEAGIERYMISAVLDEVTTDTCRFLDGKVIQTADALRTFERLETSEDPMALKQERPWVREKAGEDGQRHLMAGQKLLAVIERSGLGVRDDRGSYSRALSGRELAPAGVGFPPFHGYCRTSTTPDI
jgi:SPP1 gp7 family putative phage head morphogenesis protein